MKKWGAHALLNQFIKHALVKTKALGVLVYIVVPSFGATVRNMPPLAFDIYNEHYGYNRWIVIGGLLLVGPVQGFRGGGGGCNNFVPVLRGNGTKIAPTGDIFDQPFGGMSWIRVKLADHVGDHVVLSPEEGVLVTSPGTESSYLRLPQSLNNSWTLVLPRDSW